MPRLIDLTGKKFGKLTVLFRSPNKNKRTYWHCLCDCGKKINIRGDSLTSGNTTSCGCIKNEIFIKQAKERKENLIGQKFNHLIVISENFSKARTAWNCKCNCGNYCVVTSSNLKGNKIKSCGCLQKENVKQALQNKPNVNKKNIIGNKYGYLTVKEELGHQGKDIMYKCKCQCGNETVVSGNHLRNNHTLSCGCLKSSFYEKVIENILQQLNIPYQKEKTFSTCLNPKTNALLRFDFFINKQILLEYDGEQHTKPSINLNDIQYRDKIKDNWCKENKIPLIRISYKEKKMINEEYLLQKLLDYGYSIK